MVRVHHDAGTGQITSHIGGAMTPAYWRRKILSSLVMGVLAAAASACGGGSSASPPAAGPSTVPTPAPAAAPPIVRISPAGTEPRQLVVAVGERVTFINNDVQPHDIAGGPDPATPDCREIDAVGFLAPGQSRQTAALPVARTCDYHDHQNHAPIFTGRIVIR
jgi:plastocyanin